MIQAVKAVAVKEFRENLAWAGLISLVTSAGLANGLYNQFNQGRSILGNIFLTLCMVMYPASGLALGLLQGFADARRGRWQFVSHRPMSRSVMLGTKVVVGIALYLLATGLPLLVVIRWVATPGHVPGPFEWNMVQPALAYLLWGLIWYSAGLLVACRKASWFASRLLPIGGALAGSFASYLLAWTLSESILITLFSTVAILIGVFGVFQREGETSRAPLWAKPSIGLCVLIGLILVLAIGTMLGDAVALEIFPRAQQEGTYRLYHLADDGQMQIWTYSPPSNAVQKVQDLSGRPVKLPPRDYWDDSNLSTVSLYVPTESQRNSMAIDSGFLQPGMHIVPLEYRDPNWFYLPSTRTIEEYDSQSHRILGRLGPHGFIAPNDRPDPFPENSVCGQVVGGESLLNCPGGVYQLDLAKKSVSKLYTALPGDPVVAASTTFQNNKLSDGATVPTITVFETRNSLHIIQDQNSELVIPINDEYLRDSGEGIAVNRFRNGRFQIDYGTNYPVGMLPVEIEDYDSTGKLLKQTLVPITTPEQSHDAWDLESIGAITLCPPAFFATALTIKQSDTHLPAHGILLLIATAAGYVTIMYRMLRRRHAGRGQMIIWLILAAGLGLSGIALLLTMLEKPRFVRCPHCRGRRLLTEAACPRCATPAEPPTMEGIEIFEHQQVLAS